jgi:hypothetical protein
VLLFSSSLRKATPWAQRVAFAFVFARWRLCEHENIYRYI